VIRSSPQRLPSHIRRRRLAALALLAIIVAVAVVALVSGGSSGPKRLVPGGGGPGVYDPLGYGSTSESDLAQRAATGFSDVVWDKTPGGVVVTARRTARWRSQIEQSAKANGIDPDTLEAIVFLESAGRPDAIAGGIDGAVGLTQILPSTATALLGMHVDVARSKALTAQIASASTQRKARELERERRAADQRFDPKQAIGAAAIYLAMAKKKFGRDDLAIATYHMGMGNLDTVLSRYKAQGGADHPSYTKLYFDTAPLLHPRAYSLLSSLGDDSSTYLWRVNAARQVMRLYRSNPKQLSHLEALESEGGGGQRRLYPGGAPNESLGSGKPPKYPGLKFTGAAATNFGPDAAARAALVYMGLGTRAISKQGPLEVTSAHGVRLEVARHYKSQAQALAFQYMLDRLQAWNLIAWGRGGRTLAIVVGPEAAKVLPSPSQMLRDAARKRS
jgi:hypothetical protein